MCVCTQEARLEECERMLVAMDLALWLNDGISALQAVVTCYGLLTPLIFHQVHHSPIVEVCKETFTYVVLLLHNCSKYCVCSGTQKVFGSFRSDFKSSKAKVEWKNLGIICAHDSLHHLLPCKGVCLQYLLLIILSLVLYHL